MAGRARTMRADVDVGHIGHVCRASEASRRGQPLAFGPEHLHTLSGRAGVRFLPQVSRPLGAVDARAACWNAQEYSIYMSAQGLRGARAEFERSHRFWST